MCVSKLTIISSDVGLSTSRCQAISWTNVRILWIRTLEKYFSEILSKIHTFSITKMHLKMSSAKWWQFWFGLNVVIDIFMSNHSGAEAEMFWYKSIMVYVFYGRDHLFMHPANERRRYIVTPSPIGWAQTQNDPYNGERLQLTAPSQCKEMTKIAIILCVLLCSLIKRHC